MSASKMLLLQELRDYAVMRDCHFDGPSLQTYVMSRAITEQIVTQSRRLVEFTVSKWLKLTQFHLFTPLFDSKKELCNGKTYKKYEKRAFRL